MSKVRTSPADALNKAHKVLLEDLQQLEDAVGSSGAETAASVTARLSRVRTHIHQHFRFEEQDGYMDAVVKRQPHQERAVEQLREEHRQLAQALETIYTEASAGKTLDDLFRETVRVWLAQVRDHESRENGLVQDTFNLDIGAED